MEPWLEEVLKPVESTKPRCLPSHISSTCYRWRAYNGTIGTGDPFEYDTARAQFSSARCSWKNEELAAIRTLARGCTCAFVSWSDSDVQKHAITTPAEPAIYTVMFWRMLRR
jgi:hypothetical protein